MSDTNDAAPGTVYLIHFDTPLHHARHYLGWCNEGGLERRLARHRAGNGSKLMRAIKEHGITWKVVRTWEGDRNLERKLHNIHGSRLCPVCREENGHGRKSSNRNKISSSGAQRGKRIVS